MLYALAYLISALTGIFTLSALLGSKGPRLPLLVFLGTLLGLGMSAMLTWSSFIIFDRLIASYVIVLHILVLLAAAFLAWRRGGLNGMVTIKGLDRWDLAGLAVITVLALPVILYAGIYPYGGWDAWSCWNLKARFLFLGGPQWRAIFDPALWQSNTTYPLLLPLMNTWVWCFGHSPAPVVPQATSCLIAVLTAGTLLGGARELCRYPARALLAPVLIFAGSFTSLLAASQYSDLLTGAWLLTALLAFFFFLRTSKTGWIIVEAMALALLSFTKTEGMLLAAITGSLTMIALGLRHPAGDRRTTLIVAAAAFLIAAIPAGWFLLHDAPASGGTFINGLVSGDKPADGARFMSLLAFTGKELVSLKWGGFWLIVLAGLILAGRCALRRRYLIIPAVVGIYLAGVALFYYTNTFFEITWWLSTTLHRVLFSLMPAAALWLFLALDDN